MCFSAAASFIAGVSLTTIGVVTLKKARNRAEIPFASIPLLFGIQQLIEGTLWLAFRFDILLLKVVMTYHAWLAIFSWGCCSMYSQMSVSKVIRGRAAIKPPKRSLRLAISETSTTTAAVSKYLVINHHTLFLLHYTQHQAEYRYFSVALERPSSVQANSILMPIKIRTVPPNSSALLSNHVPLFLPTITPHALKQKVTSPMVRQAR